MSESNLTETKRWGYEVDLTFERARTRLIEPEITYYIMEIPDLPGYGCGYRLSPDGFILEFMAYYNRHPMDGGQFWSPFNFNTSVFNLATGKQESSGFEGKTCPVDFMVGMIRDLIKRKENPEEDPI